jgi:hypothetical protein
VIDDPPSESGTLHVSETVPPVPVPDTPSGSEGNPEGITALEMEEVVELPVVFDAAVVNVYEVPLVSDEIVQLVAGEITWQVAPPGDAVIV